MKKNNEINIFNNVKKNVYIHFAFLFSMFIWLFTIMMMPVNYQNSGTLTVVYFKNINLTLTPLGIVTIIFFSIFLLHLLFLIVLFILKKESIYFFKNLPNPRSNWAFLVSWIFLFVVLIIIFGFVFAQPNTSEFINKLEFQVFVNNLDINNISQKEHDIFINYVNKYNLVDELKKSGLGNYQDFIGTNVSFNSNVKSFLKNVYINFSPSHFTPLYKVFQSQISFDSLYYFSISIFSISIIYFVIASLVLVFINNKSSENRITLKQKKEMLKLFANEFKQKIKTKRETKEKRKLLLKEEEELLLGLKDYETFNEVPTISQEELQEKINKNNEIKNRIHEIHEKQKKLKNDSRFFKQKTEKEEINKRSTKIKKHEITIPDEELEEIFKNLDI